MFTGNRIHHLIMWGRTYTHTIYLYIYVYTQLGGFHDINQSPGLGLKKTLQELWAAALSLVMLIPGLILTRPGHIFNLWALQQRPEATGWAPEEERETPAQRERVFMSQPLQCKQLGRCLSPPSGNTLVLFSLSPLQMLWNCFRSWSCGPNWERSCTQQVLWSSHRTLCITSVGAEEQTVSTKVYQRSEQLRAAGVPAECLCQHALRQGISSE